MINLSFVINDKDTKIYCLRCDACCKFIKKSYTEFHCPHCGASFLEGVTADQLSAEEELLDYVEEVTKLAREKMDLQLFEIIKDATDDQNN